MITSNVPARGDDASVAAYENLRRQVLAGSSGSNHGGLVVLLREGVAAWIASCIASAAIAEIGPTPEGWLRTASPPLSDANEFHAGVVRLLAGMALASPGEMRR